MSSGMKEASTKDIIQNLNEKNLERLNDSLQTLTLTFQSESGSEATAYFPSLFQKLQSLFTSDNLSVVVQASQLLLEISNNYPTEAEPYYEQLIDRIVINLGDNKVHPFSPL
jgi:hypothetical protein